MESRPLQLLAVFPIHYNALSTLAVPAPFTEAKINFTNQVKGALPRIPFPATNQYVKGMRDALHDVI